MNLINMYKLLKTETPKKKKNEIEGQSRAKNYRLFSLLKVSRARGYVGAYRYISAIQCICILRLEKLDDLMQTK